MIFKINHELIPQGIGSSKSFYAITIKSIADNINNSFTPFFYKQLISDTFKWVEIEKLLSQKYLVDNNIEFILNKEREIIPIGLIDFFKGGGDDELRLLTDNQDSLHKIKQIIKNILQAIEIKHEGYKLAQRCKNKKSENIDIF